MPKEATVLLVCLLILLADVLSFWRTISLWLAENSFFSDLSSIAILAVLGLLTVLLLRVNYVLVRRIISKQTG